MKSSNNSSKHRFGGLLVGVLILALSFTSAQAQILFSNGLDVTGGTAAYYEAGDVFTPTSSGTANYVDFVGIYVTNPATPPSDSFILDLNSTSSGAPDALIDTNTLSSWSRSAVGTSLLGFTIYQFGGYLNTPFNLTAGTSYYLGFIDTTTPYGAFAMAGTTVPGLATSEYSYSSDTGFVNNPGLSLAFDIGNVASTPEPASWTLGLCVVALLAVLRARMRRELVD